jgi:hypothetical protein
LRSVIGERQLPASQLIEEVDNLFNRNSGLLAAGKADVVETASYNQYETREYD